MIFFDKRMKIFLVITVKEYKGEWSEKGSLYIEHHIFDSQEDVNKFIKKHETLGTYDSIDVEIFNKDINGKFIQY